MAQLLPGPGGEPTDAVAEPAAAHRTGPGFATALGDRAAAAHHELLP